MNSKDKKRIFIAARDIPRVILILIIIILIIVGSYDSGIEKYSNLILVAVTTIYAYFTYELLRATRANKSFPYIKIELIFVSKLNSDFFKKYEQNIEHGEDFLRVKQDFDSGTFNDRNLVFLRVQNVGNNLAIGVNVDVKFNKKTSLDGLHMDSSKELNFGDLKEGDEATKLFCVFEHASSNDFLKINKVEVSFKDIDRHNNGESPWKHDATSNITYKQEEGVSIVTKREQL